MRCRRAAGVGTCRTSRGMEFWKCAAGVLRVWGRVGLIDVWSSEALEVRGRRVAPLPQELWRRAAGVGTWRSLPQEVWGSGVWLLLEFLAFVPHDS